MLGMEGTILAVRICQQPLPSQCSVRWINLPFHDQFWVVLRIFANHRLHVRPSKTQSKYVLYLLLFAVFQDLAEDAPVHRVRGDLGGPGSGRGHLQADRHQQGAGRSQLLCAEKTVRRGEGHNTNVHVSIIPICEISQFEISSQRRMCNIWLIMGFSIV